MTLDTVLIETPASRATSWSEDVAVEWSLASGWPPLRSDIPADDVASNEVVAALTEISDTSRPLLPGVSQSVDVLTAVDVASQKALAGGDPAELLSQAQSDIEQALAR